MATVGMDRQAIERQDFPIARRGYATAAVDAHLRVLAAEIEELRQTRPGEWEPTLALMAGTHVQSIVQAAEAAATDVGRQALQSARNVREEADREAERTREQAIQQARTHVAAVARATSVLLERVSAIDGEVGALVESVRAGAGRLAGDLAAVETNMSELYDAAAGYAVSPVEQEPMTSDFGAELPATGPPEASSQQPPAPAPVYAPAPATVSAPPSVLAPAIAPAPAAAPAPAPISASAPVVADDGTPRETAAPATTYAQAGVPAATEANGDLDSARLIALNMALNGESRAEADRYLAENFQLADREKLVEEVYAAIEG
jgi:hypothetical protein